MLCFRRDCANNTVVRLLTYLLFGCRQAAVGMMTWGRVGRILAWPLKVAASMLQRPLNKVSIMGAVDGGAQEHFGQGTGTHYVDYVVIIHTLVIYKVCKAPTGPQSQG
jgi:hypothetical protein